MSKNRLLKNRFSLLLTKKIYIYICKLAPENLALIAGEQVGYNPSVTTERKTRQQYRYRYIFLKLKPTLTFSIFEFTIASLIFIIKLMKWKQRWPVAEMGWGGGGERGGGIIQDKIVLDSNGSVGNKYA